MTIQEVKTASVIFAIKDLQWTDANCAVSVMTRYVLMPPKVGNTLTIKINFGDKITSCVFQKDKLKK